MAAAACAFLPSPTLSGCSSINLRAAKPCQAISARRVQFASFSGLHSHASVLQLSMPAEPFASTLPTSTSNGSRWFAMRHGCKVPRLGRPADQRKALLRGLTTEILRHGRIKTTLARAKAMRKHVDHVITLAKRGTDHARGQVLGYVYDKVLVASLFEEVPDRYGEREGGYTRIIRTMPRKGDGAPMAYIELVE
eukprot:TRINITY_DN1216_c0_g1_i1.p1 TRINITY_DN1216_c0_g1~~TRINITY_DN1216_c0_g1_i1.p1  ORF type:complete len:194 (-),score=23.55 TRINITY_DN1216_c0_g1_i1:150-731(-)